MVRRTLAIAVVVIAFGAAGACRGSDDGGDRASVASDESDRTADDLQQSSANATAGAASGASDAGQDAAAAEGAPADTAGASAGAQVGAPLPQGLGQSKIVKTASIDIEVPDGAFNAAFAKVPGIAAANGGFVASSTSTQARESGDDGNRQAAGSLVVRVPAENFEAARSQLIALGELESQQLKGEDVGGRLTDLEARLRNLRSHEEAIRLLMSKANTVGETIEVQRQLFAVREQIEQLSGEQARLADAVALSTITLSLAEPGAVARGPGNRSPLADAWQRAVDGAQSVLAGLIVGLGYLVPLALLLGAGWLVARPFLRRRETETAPTNP